MQMFTSETCSKFQYDNTLPIEMRSKCGNTCLACVHSLKVSHGGEVDIVPCGKPEPYRQPFPTPR